MIIGELNVKINTPHQYVLSGVPSAVHWFWSVSGGIIIGDSTSNVVSITPTSANCIVSCIVNNAQTYNLTLVVCVPNTTGLIIQEGQAIKDLTNDYTLQKLNGTYLNYIWEVEGGIIIEGGNTNKIKVLWLESGTVSVKLINCEEHILSKSIFVCIPAPDFEIEGENTILLPNELYQYSVNIFGNYIFNWIVQGGEIKFGLNTNTIQVLWKQNVEHKIILSIVSCNFQSRQKELNVSLDLIPNISETPVLGSECCINCLNKCNEIYGTVKPYSIVKGYKEGFLVVYTQADKRGVYHFKICNVSSLYITQTEPNKLESEKSNTLLKCVECEIPIKHYERSPICDNRC